MPVTPIPFRAVLSSSNLAWLQRMVTLESLRPPAAPLVMVCTGTASAIAASCAAAAGAGAGSGKALAAGSAVILVLGEKSA